ncbi:mRNA capping enzyme-domain-containing protein [Collybia nuda]|uniref:mRNA cap guanine-N(7) methyltransferase n=1 Tax=Collybia nuda TaxID=64659 RepID=A0A9P5Y391_9AGAR|nr:mRNA capping enzyme-domain-containing protein [Collybia nuda]
MKGTIDLIVDFAEKQKEKEIDRLNTGSAFRRAQDWIDRVYHAENDKGTIAELRNQFQRDSNLILITAAFVHLAPAIKSGHTSTPAITTGMPMTRPGRKAGDLVPYFLWIKMATIERWGSPVLTSTKSAAVLDIACGKGGDIHRWKVAGAKLYVGLDSDKGQIAWASKHLETVRNPPSKFRAEFSVVDCFDSSLSDVQFPFGVKRFDIVSIQVSMHIVWKTQKRAKQTLKNVGKSLRKGGIFVGTMFDDERAQAMARKLPAARERSFGNTAYKVTFSTQDSRDFGRRYVFSLFGTAENRRRYVVPWKVFVKTAGWYGLRLKEVKSFKEIFEEEHATPDYRKKLHEMNIIDEGNNLYMDLDQWEAVNFYIAFMFIKDD